jgi:hypothetical protein
MIHENVQHLIARLGQCSASELDASLACIPIIDEEVFRALIEEAFSVTSGDETESCCIALDGYSAGVIWKEHACAAGQMVVVMGDAPDGWDADGISVRGLDALSLVDSDRVCVICSSRVRVAFFGSVDDDPGGERGFVGGWSVAQGLLDRVASTLFGASLSDLDSSEVWDEALGSGVVTRLMAVHANSLLRREKSIAKDNDDLSSVLDILKAISSKRRAHDVLFVFVERISQVIRSKRCSVVRVWGGGRHGHVLASHEDQSVTEHSIVLDKYPELLRSMEVRDKVVVNDAQQHPLMAPIAENLAAAEISSILVIPIMLFDENVRRGEMRDSLRVKRIFLKSLRRRLRMRWSVPNCLRKSSLRIRIWSGWRLRMG